MDIANIIRYAPSVDAIATDFPYARSTTTKGEKLASLYNRAFETIAHVLKKKKYAVTESQTGIYELFENSIYLSWEPTL